LKVDAFGQFLQSFLIVALSSKEKSSEVYLKVGLVTLDFVVIDKRVFVFRIGTTFVILVTGELEQVPVSGDEELLSLLETGATHADVSLGQDEIGWEQLNRVFLEDIALDGLVHLAVDVSVGLLNLPLDNHLFGLLDGLIDLGFPCLSHRLFVISFVHARAALHGELVG